MSLTTTSARHAEPGSAGRPRASTRFAGSAAVVGALVLLVSSVNVPAQAHHRTDHPKASPSPPTPSTHPTQRASALSGDGVRDIDEECADVVIASGCTHYRDLVRGQVVWTEGDATGPAAGLTVTVTASGTSTEQRIVTTNEGGYFYVDFGSAMQPLTWTASTDGNDLYEASQASGVFVPYVDHGYFNEPPGCWLSWDC